MEPTEIEEKKEDVVEDQKEVDQKAAEQKAEYDKQQQMIDQERANARRAKEQADQAVKEKDALQTQLSQTKEQIEELKTRTDELNRQKIDPNAVDIPEVAQYAQNIEAETLELKKQQADLKKELDEIKTQKAKDAQEQTTQKAQEQILVDCDDEFGAQFRNEALKLADDLCAKGDEPYPSSQYDGARLMRKCYKQIAFTKTPKKDKTPTDTGGGTVATPKTAKPGKFEDVLDEMKKNPSSWQARAG